MSPDIDLFRHIPATSLMRYRVTGGAQCEIIEGVAMVVAPGFMVAGLLIVRGLLIVKRVY